MSKYHLCMTDWLFYRKGRARCCDLEQEEAKALTQFLVTIFMLSASTIDLADWPRYRRLHQPLLLPLQRVPHFREGG